ncbi:MAG: hypothetical protein RQ899_14840 [Pseudomonadales bacterium]|nr:hypothetical protein [Pseudomonadales bacterium]
MKKTYFMLAIMFALNIYPRPSFAQVPTLGFLWWDNLAYFTSYFTDICILFVGGQCLQHGNFSIYLTETANEFGNYSAQFFEKSA